MPTEVIKYVDPDGGILADYTSLQAAITAEKAIRSDLVARDEVLKLICINSAGSPDIIALIASGDFITDATRKIVIEGDNTTGIFNTAKYHIIANSGETGLTIVNCNVTVKNIQVKSSGFQNINQSGNYQCEFVGNVLIGGGADALSFTTRNAYVFNNVIYNAAGAGIRVQSGDYNVFLYNNTVYNCGIGINFNFATDNTAINNLLINNSQDYYNNIPGATFYSAANITSDTTSPDGASYQSISVNFTDAANGDFRLLAGSPGIDQGVDLSSDPNYPFNTDIIGTLRPQGAAWDIGAFEYVDPFVYQDLTAKIEAQTSMRASLSKKLELAGVFDAATQLKSLLVIDRNFSAIIKTDSAITAQAVKVIALSGDIRSLSDLKLSLSADRRFAGRIESFSMISARLSLPVLIEEISLNAPGLTVVDLSAPGNNILNLKASYL